VLRRKLAGPGLAARAIGSVGQDFLPQPGQVFTTVAKAQRLGGNAVGLAAWEAPAITKPDGGALWVTATPARHGPAGIEALSGDVVGFVLSFDEGPTIMSPATRSGSMASPRRFRPGIVLLFVGAAKKRPLSSHHGRERCHRDRARFSAGPDRSGALRPLGAF
jgi:hypothetical protein